jgi:hypothetical protein
MIENNARLLNTQHWDSYTNAAVKRALSCKQGALYRIPSLFSLLLHWATELRTRGCAVTHQATLKITKSSKTL